MDADAESPLLPEWEPVEGGRTVGMRGTEGGGILRDEEHGAGARITLECPGALGAYAVTCGVYGFFVHTAYAEDETEGQRKYDAMREQLVEIMSLPEADEAAARVDAFVKTF